MFNKLKSYFQNKANADNVEIEVKEEVCKSKYFYDMKENIDYILNNTNIDENDKKLVIALLKHNYQRTDKVFIDSNALNGNPKKTITARIRQLHFNDELKAYMAIENYKTGNFFNIRMRLVTKITDFETNNIIYQK